MLPRRLTLLLPLLAPACATSEPVAGFLDDAAFLKDHADGEIVISGTGAFFYSPQLQGRVMTSTVNLTEAGYGFVNRSAVAAPDTEAAFHNYGGEERLWIGPEGSRFSFFFEPGDPMDRSVWRVPTDLDQGAFTEVAFAEMERTMHLANIAGTTFDLHLRRKLDAPSREVVEDVVGALPEGTQWTAFRSHNTLTNAGDQTWTREGGLPNLWLMGMFLPGDRSWAILPFRTDRADADGGPPVRSDYFGALDQERLRLGDGYALFRTDAHYTSKVGILRDRARDVLGAYDPERGVLTVIRFGPVVEGAPYTDERWLTEDDPYYGDVVNSYNHGGPETFFELESSSPALELAPGDSHTHWSMTIHLRFPDDASLARAVKQAFGLDWTAVKALADWD